MLNLLKDSSSLTLLRMRGSSQVELITKHFAIVQPLRAPNDEKVAKLLGVAIRKVFKNIREIDVEKVAKGK